MGQLEKMEFKIIQLENTICTLKLDAILKQSSQTLNKIQTFNMMNK